jgi:glycosyltransferase involved in cell wall biosynthesis
MKPALSICMLLSDGFGGFGGIAKFNRDFLAALDACELVDQVKVLPRLIPEPVNDVPEAVVYDRKAASGVASYLLRAATEATGRRPVDLVICGHINLLPLSYALARMNRARLALIIHGIEAWQPLKYRVARFVRSIDRLIAVSRCTADRFCAWAGLEPRTTCILPNCVDLESFVPGPRDPALIARYGLAGCKVIMTMGRLAAKERYKGFDEVLDILPQLARRFDNLKYLIVGGGSDRPRLESKAAALGISERVVFTGRIGEAEKVAHYNLADAFVMPSSGEGFGIVLIEAAACGVPVIGSTADGSREALLHGRLGRLIDPAKPDELMAAVTAVLGEDTPRQRNALVQTFGVGGFRRRVHDWCTELVQ